ncbi:MAG: hypothetical protein ACRDLU_04745 [Gaiellaceae bacterium]
MALVACGGSGGTELPTGSEPVTLDPADFTTEITNPYWPMTPGDRWVYRETDGEGGEQKVEVTVTDRKKTIMGIEALVVHDVVSEDGQLVEDTFDWYAQDADGNVWYLGEDTAEYENGKLTTREGSWEGGVDGALPGIIVPANPEPGQSYREEYYEGHAEDGAEVLTLAGLMKVPFGVFADLLQTRNYSPLEPNYIEEKFYARGVGPVATVAVSGGTGREGLISRS